MRNYILILLLSVVAWAKPVEKADLLKYADQYSIKDNRAKLERDKDYFTMMVGEGEIVDHLKPHYYIRAYGGPEIFKQISVNCRQCKTKEFSKELIELCQTQVSQLAKSIWNIDFSKNNFHLTAPQIEKNRWDSKRVTLKNPSLPARLKLYSTKEKCDVYGGGLSLRVDIFPE